MKFLLRWLKIYIIVATIALIGLLVIARLERNQPNDAQLPHGDPEARAAWNKELTDGAKAFYGDDWKPTEKDKRVIDAMAGEAAKTYGTPSEDGDR